MGGEKENGGGRKDERSRRLTLSQFCLGLALVVGHWASLDRCLLTLLRHVGDVKETEGPGLCSLRHLIGKTSMSNAVENPGQGKMKTDSAQSACG